MGKVSYQAWARNQACASAYTMLFGGIISILYRTQISADAVLINVTTGLGAYACLIGLIILAVERPLPGIEKMGAAITNFWVRVVFYGIALVPLLSQAPLLASGFFLFVTTCFYAKAAHSGEVWVNPLDTKGGGGEAAPKREEKKKEEKKDDKKDDKKDKKPTITSMPADREYVSQSHLQPQYAGGYEQDAQPNYGGGYGGGYDQQGYDQGYDQQGYDQQGYDQQGYDQQGYDQQGYTS